jgi:hypothetical protein
MRVALYVTCLVDLMRPSVAFASLRLLEAAGCEVIVPEGQTCCGQPAWSAGERALAADLARKAIGELEGYDYVVIPSGSCADDHPQRIELEGRSDRNAGTHPAARSARRAFPAAPVSPSVRRSRCT